MEVILKDGAKILKGYKRLADIAEKNNYHTQTLSNYLFKNPEFIEAINGHIVEKENTKFFDEEGEKIISEYAKELGLKRKYQLFEVIYNKYRWECEKDELIQELKTLNGVKVENSHYLITKSVEKYLKEKYSRPKSDDYERLEDVCTRNNWDYDEVITAVYDYRYSRREERIYVSKNRIESIKEQLDKYHSKVEKAKRFFESGKCVYCDDESPIRVEVFPSFYGAEYYGIDVDFDINFCPNCGRKLED